ncbi:MAG TPA: NFACT RNA binding domain-containing protein [Pyrinomonadaceae bacterium]|nr:NFACT RNA binding domain-containing protein [Pyrinomonadaceae bacterium]
MSTETPADKSEKTEAEARFDQLASTVRRKAISELKKHQKLIANLNSDLEKHGDAERWKRYGDLLLANVHTAQRDGDIIRVTDYFDDAVPIVEIEGEVNKPLSEIAEGYFRRYVKARNGNLVIEERMAATEIKLAAANEKLHLIDVAIEEENEEYLKSLVAPPRKPIAIARKKKKEVEFNGARRFISTDGFEILVGKKATDNDYLTFRVARSLDTWMHAADYPGSHVVIRNANRKEIPNRTLLEAAQLAAFYSNGRSQVKAAVHYTLKKFVNKPKRSAPGLVSLSSFKTILVEPQVPLQSE